MLKFEDEVLNTTEILLGKKIASCENNCFIHNISLLIIGTLLLVAVSIGCSYYYTRYCRNGNIYYHLGISSLN